MFYRGCSIVCPLLKIRPYTISTQWGWTSETVVVVVVYECLSLYGLSPSRCAHRERMCVRYGAEHRTHTWLSRMWRCMTTVSKFIVKKQSCETIPRDLLQFICNKLIKNEKHTNYSKQIPDKNFTFKNEVLYN